MNLSGIPKHLIRHVQALERAGCVVIAPSANGVVHYPYSMPAPPPAPLEVLGPNYKSAGKKSALLVRGMWGIGDSIHQRAVVRQLMRSHDVWLETPYVSAVADLFEQGLHLSHNRRTIGRIREATTPLTKAMLEQVPPADAKLIQLTYTPETIKKYGSILAAQFASAGLEMPERPDFSMPVPEAWRARVRERLPKHDKPLMVYRPIVLNTGWECPARAPDPKAYGALFQAIRNDFFVVSVASLAKDKEWIVPPHQEVDCAFEHGELDFESLAGLFAEAALVFGNAGFVPVLAQAVGTPNIIVYGGNESFRTTNSVGRHLAPTLAIDIDKPCECHMRTHECNKTITLPPAIERVKDFAAIHARKRKGTLIFATTYADTPERRRLTELWVEVHRAINPDCDFLIVDSKSPRELQSVAEFANYDPQQRSNMMFYSFPENIGHLSRNGGRDGWGRAFCFGLQAAIDCGYEYVVHIEGDSLFRLPITPIVRYMRDSSIDSISVPVKGTRRDEVGWVETGLMFFRTQYVEESGFIKKYDWPNAQYRQTPEWVIHNMLAGHLQMMPWKALRGDKNQITKDNVLELNLDWVTHSHTDAEVYERYAKFVLGSLKGDIVGVDKINLGCGTNRLSGWRNFDSEIDIRKPLPFASNSAAFIFAEHVVEHIDYYEAISFFKECFRVLIPGGVVRIAVPCLDNVWKRATPEYIQFVKKWAGAVPGLRGALHAMVTAHGHKTAWTTGLLEATLFYSGFDSAAACEVGKSAHHDLIGVEGHGRVIGDVFNAIETGVVEAVKGS